MISIRTLADVRRFTAIVTAYAVLGTLVSNWLVLTPDLFRATLYQGLFNALAVGGPVSYYIGLRFKEVHDLKMELEHVAAHDGMTGLLTRAAFFDAVAARVSGGCAVLLDIDHFKLINDTHGHFVGDTVIRQVAETIRANCREGDILCRFGGEEFMVYLVGADSAQGLILAERLRRAVAERVLVTEAGPLRATISIGMTPIAAPDGITAALRLADRALYMAKEGGRNRVELLAA